MSETVVLGGKVLVFCFLTFFLNKINIYELDFFFPQEIDDYIVQAKERGYETMVNFGRQGLNLAATAAVTAAVKVIFYLPLFLIQCHIASEQSRVAFYFRSL